MGRALTATFVGAATAALGTVISPTLAEAQSGPCGATGVFSSAAGTDSCTYTSAGTEDTFSVPAGLTSTAVTLVGAGGGGGAGGAGGAGAVVTNSGLPVPSGAVLYVVDEPTANAAVQYVQFVAPDGQIYELNNARKAD